MASDDFEDPKEIWLQPWCARCSRVLDREWCEDEVFGTCPDCGKKPVRYVLAGETAAPDSEPRRDANVLVLEGF